MCLSRAKAPSPDKAAEAEQEQQKEEAQIEKKELKQDALGATVKRKKGGLGRRALIKTSGGGMGYYNKYLS